MKQGGITNFKNKNNFPPKKYGASVDVYVELLKQVIRVRHLMNGLVSLFIYLFIHYAYVSTYFT